MGVVSGVPEFSFPVTVRITDERLQQLEALAGDTVQVGGVPILGLDNVVRLARRALALEAALRGDPGHDVTSAVVQPTGDRTKAVWNWERMGRALLAITPPFAAEVCRVCGCTETTPCVGPVSRTVSYADGRQPPQIMHGHGACGWVPGTNHTLCDAPACVEAGLATGVLGSAWHEDRSFLGGGRLWECSCGWTCRAETAPDECDRCLRENLEEVTPGPVEPMAHRCGTCSVKDGHEPGCPENDAPLEADLAREFAADRFKRDAADPCYGHACDEFPGLHQRPASS